MKTSMDKVIRNALIEMGVEAVEKKGTDCTIFLCNYMFVNIEIRVYETCYLVIYTYSCLKNVLDEDLNNILKFFSMINGWGGIRSNGLIFNVNLLNDNHYVFSAVYVDVNINATILNPDDFSYSLKSKYYKDLKEQFIKIYSYNTSDAFHTYPFILAVLEEADPKTVWEEWKKRKSRATSIFKNY